jgi:selenocysteine lyase/cysteine desulfurase
LIIGETDEINFDNAATTPPLKNALKAVRELIPFYSSVHRGSGVNSRISSEFYEDSRWEIMDFFGADVERDVIIYMKNTTDAINKLAVRLSRTAGDKDTVISTFMEHHSNILPWRKNFRVVCAKLTPEGRLDLEDLEKIIKENAKRARLVAVTAASNVTGYVNQIHHIAEISHKYGVEIFADCAQYAPHLPLNMKKSSDNYIDYIAFSAHKMYAPFGVGALIGPRESFKGEPVFPGGGTVEFVDEDDVIWSEPPGNEEGGTPNLFGVAALLATVRTFKQLGMNNISRREEGLTSYALKKLSGIDGIKLYSDLLPPRIGIITFNLKDIYHETLAAALSDKAGIAVRSGCFCAQPYVQRLLRLSKQEINYYKNNPSYQRPGMVRVSFGFYNRKKEVDVLADFLKS